MNYCRLCLKPSFLCDSHIIPEFFYQYLYDPAHRFRQISMNESIDRHKGIYEKLLCPSCETKFNETFENYAKEVIFGGREIVGFDAGRNITITNIDYNTFKLFQLSLIWRMGISKRKEFININLGNKHEEILRKMLLDDNPGKPSEYPCILVYNIRKSEIDFKHLMISPQKGLRFDGHRTYMLVLGDLIWNFIVSGYPIRGNTREHIWLDERGLIIHKIDADKTHILSQLFKIVNSSSKNQ
jgi:hypothetical protein